MGMVRSLVTRRPEVGVPVVLLVACLAGGPLTTGGLARALASGVVTALVAVSVVLVFRVEEVVSYAQFGLAALAAATLATASGPSRLAVLLPVVLAGSAAVTWALGRWVLLRLSRSPRVIGTLAAMLAMQLLLAARLWWGTTPQGGWVPPFSWYIIGLGGVALAIAMPILLRPLLRKNARPSLVSVVAGLLAGGAGLFSALLFPSGTGPLSAATVAGFPVVGMATAMVAAAMAGFRDPGTAVLSAFALSVALEVSEAGFGSSGPYLLILMPLLSAALLLRPKQPAPPTVDTDVADPPWPASVAVVLKGMRARLIVAFAVGVPVLAVLAGRRPVVAELAGYCLVGLSLMMLMGWIGQVTLGQLGFAALGGWITVACGLPTPLGILLGALVGTVLSPLVAYTAIRHAGAPAPVTSLAWGVFAYTLFTSPEMLGWDRVLSQQTDPLTATPDGRPDFIVAIAVVGCLATVAVVGKTKFGRVLAAARLDSGVARRAGMVLPRARLTALLLTGFVAATGGGLLATAQNGLLASGYATDSGVRLVTSTGTGGVGAIAGPIAGALVFGGVILVTFLSGVRFLLTGVLGLTVLTAEPAGLLGLWRRGSRRTVALLSRLRRKVPVPVPVVVVPAEDEVAVADSQI
jgi:branched-chain amino acid transport system permease protein